MTDEEKSETFKKWHDLMNMSKAQLDRWADDPDHLLASLNRQEAGSIQSGFDSLRRIRTRITKKKDDWTADDYKAAKREISFVSRMLGNSPGDPVGDSGMSKWEISLKNWGHDPSLKSSPQYKKWKSWSSKKKASEDVQTFRMMCSSVPSDHPWNKNKDPLCTMVASTGLPDLLPYLDWLSKMT